MYPNTHGSAFNTTDDHVPKKIQTVSSSIPTLSHICSLLMMLPPLRPHATWSQDWLLDLPLCSTLEQRTDDTRNPVNIPIKYTVADILIQSDRVIQVLESGLAAQSQNMIIAIMRDFRAKKIGWAPWLSRMSSVENVLMNKTDDPIPNCDEWSPQDTERKKTKIADIAIGKLWQYWHKENDWCQQPPRPPLHISAGWRIPGQKWIIFWKLSIPHRPLYHGGVCYMNVSALDKNWPDGTNLALVEQSVRSA